MTVLIRGLFVWLVIVSVEFVHGVARTFLLEPHIGDFRARQVSVFTGSAIILAIAIAFVRWIRAESVGLLVATGVLWLALALGFEVALGRLVLGYSWERTGSDYDILRGGLLPIGMLVLLVAPLVAAKLRRLI